MPTRVRVGTEDLDWAKTLVGNMDPLSMARAMAERVGCCVDTAKRILHRNDIVEFEGAKYEKSRASQTLMWTRPCMCCGDTTPRPKNIYHCLPCRIKLGFDDPAGPWDEA